MSHAVDISDDPDRLRKSSRHQCERQSAIEVLPVIILSFNGPTKTKVSSNEGFNRFVG